MRALIQRVSRASVRVSGTTIGHIGPGLLVFLGVAADDTSREACLLAGKLARLRIFSDQQRLMNLSVTDIGGEVLVVSQFTLLGDARKGNRPSFSAAAAPEAAQALYQELIAELKKLGLTVAAGQFGAAMEVELVNDGPVTIWWESPAKKLEPSDRS